VGVAVLAGGLYVRWRSSGQRRLRQPTKKQSDAIAEPIGSLLARRAALLRGQRAKDLIDTLSAITRAGEYINDGPLTEPTDSGVSMPPAMTGDLTA